MTDRKKALEALDRIQNRNGLYKGDDDDVETIREALSEPATCDDAIEHFCRTWLHCGMEEAKTLHSKWWTKLQAVKEDNAVIIKPVIDDGLREAALSAAADVHGGYMNATKKRAVIAAINVITHALKGQSK